MIFRSVYHTPGALETLYALLQERTPEQSISHKKMPTFDEHRKFVMSMPYVSWMVMETEVGTDMAGWNKTIVGTVYVTRQHELGIMLFKRFHHQGYGTEALEWVRNTFKGQRLLANINPANAPSIAFFEKHGARLIQHTYEV